MTSVLRLALDHEATDDHGDHDILVPHAEKGGRQPLRALALQILRHLVRRNGNRGPMNFACVPWTSQLDMRVIMVSELATHVRSAAAWQGNPPTQLRCT